MLLLNPQPYSGHNMKLYAYCHWLVGHQGWPVQIPGMFQQALQSCIEGEVALGVNCRSARPPIAIALPQVCMQALSHCCFGDGKHILLILFATPAVKILGKQCLQLWNARGDIVGLFGLSVTLFLARLRSAVSC